MKKLKYIYKSIILFMYRFYCNWIKLEPLRIKIKHLFQRIVYGFDDSETWDLSISLYKWLLPRLKRFRELNNGWPSCKYNTFDEWDKEILKRINQLDYIINNMYNELDDPKLSNEIEDFNNWISKNLIYIWW